MATNADADISICLTCQSLGQFICHVLTMAIDLRGDEQTIRLNIEEYTLCTEFYMKPTLELCVLVSVWAARIKRGIYVVCDEQINTEQPMRR